MYGFVYYANQPSNPVNVAIQVGDSGTQCMDDVGNDVSFTMTNSGTSCYYMGYVVDKPYDTGGDNCAVVDSLWAVAYETSTDESGSTSSSWTADHEYDCGMMLRDQSPNTTICDNNNSLPPCAKTKQDWSYDTTPTYYVHRPSYHI